MSAFVHGTDHIDLIVTAAMETLDRGEREFTYWHHATQTLYRISDPTEMGRLLLSENIRSVLFRYEDIAADELEEYADLVNSYHFHRVREFGQIPHRWLVAINACQSLDYQSCESDDYRDTKAAALISRIQDTILFRMIREAQVNGWAWQRATSNA